MTDPNPMHLRAVADDNSRQGQRPRDDAVVYLPCPVCRAPLRLEADQRRPARLQCESCGTDLELPS